jgi:hypothetical protein
MIIINSLSWIESKNIRLAKGSESLISPCGKDSDDFLILFNIVFSNILNCLFKMFNQIKKMDWMSSNIWPSQIAVIIFNHLEWPVSYLVLEHFKESEIVTYQIWRMRWVEKEFMLQV